MASLRRGNITFPHKSATAVTLTKIDGQPIFLRLADISCWEEYRVSNCLVDIVVVYHGLNSTAVRESFNEVCAMIQRKAVAP